MAAFHETRGGQEFFAQVRGFFADVREINASLKRFVVLMEEDREVTKLVDNPLAEEVAAVLGVED